MSLLQDLCDIKHNEATKTKIKQLTEINCDFSADSFINALDLEKPRKKVWMCDTEMKLLFWLICILLVCSDYLHNIA